jgi:hypothetical protein
MGCDSQFDAGERRHVVEHRAINTDPNKGCEEYSGHVDMFGPTPTVNPELDKALKNLKSCILPAFDFHRRDDKTNLRWALYELIDSLEKLSKVERMEIKQEIEWMFNSYM